MNTLNSQTITTIIASLRLMQIVIDRGDLGEYELPHFEEVDPLDMASISELCESLNTESVTIDGTDSHDFAFSLRDEMMSADGDIKGKVKVCNNLGLSIGFAGYSENTIDDISGFPVYIEKFDNKLQVRIYGDINSEEPTHNISLENARIECRSPSLDNLLTIDECEYITTEGWDIYSVDGLEKEFKIKGIDELAIFKNVHDAWQYIVQLAKGGSELHQRVLAFMERHANKEYALFVQSNDEISIGAKRDDKEVITQKHSANHLQTLALPDLVVQLTHLDMGDKDFTAFTHTLSAIQNKLGQDDGGMASTYFNEDDWNALEQPERKDFLITYITAELTGLTQE